MSESKTMGTPLDVSLKLSKQDSTEKGSNEHRKMQSCDYWGTLTRTPDIAHAANLLSSFIENSGRRHGNAAKGCLRYLNGTKSEKMIFRKSEKVELT